METLNTLLSRKDLRFLEEVIVAHGRIVSFKQLKEVAGTTYSIEELRNRIALLSKKGWLLRLKKGLYVIITDISSLGFSDVSEYIIAQALNKESYISFENALQYHSMFDQMLTTVSSVTHTRARTYTVEKDKTYRFFHIRNELYFGFSEERVSGQIVRIAEREKALLDMLYFQSTSSLTASVVLEKLQEHRHDIDFHRLKQYAQRYSLTVVREIGFLLDQLQVETDDLYTVVHTKGSSYSKMSKDADTFNAKWRLYYDARLTH
jgi:predicted transcriptional regulator of viral defense system